MIEASLKLLELGYYELKIAFEGLEDAHVWQRPAPNLLSVGELAGHLAYWEAIRLAGNGADPADCRIQSPLVHAHFRYYPTTLAGEPTENPVPFAMLAALDLFTFWTLFLMIVGYAYASRLKRGQSAGIVLGIWIVVTIFRVAMAALQGAAA